MDVIFLHFANAEAPIETKLVGSSTKQRLIHDSNALSSISVTLLDMVNSDKFS